MRDKAHAAIGVESGLILTVALSFAGFARRDKKISNILRHIMKTVLAVVIISSLYSLGKYLLALNSYRIDHDDYKGFVKVTICYCLE